MGIDCEGEETVRFRIQGEVAEEAHLGAFWNGLTLEVKLSGVGAAGRVTSATYAGCPLRRVESGDG